MITSIQNPRVKTARALINERKVREEMLSLAVEGVRLAEEALHNGWPVEYALWSAQVSARSRLLLDELAKRQIPADELPPTLMAKISDTETPQGLLVVVKRKEMPLPARPDFLLALDGVRDPGNLGTILRSACAFGSQAVILLPGSADPFSSKVLRAGMGAQFRLPVKELQVEAFKDLCKVQANPALRILLADMQDAQPGWEMNLKQPLALVIGGEAAGATQQLYPNADGRGRIPMPTGSEALKAAGAPRIPSYEIMRQRQK
jgi:RNA methyltransferase, TrmH family